MRGTFGVKRTSGDYFCPSTVVLVEQIGRSSGSHYS